MSLLFTIHPTGASGGFFVAAGTAQEALDVLRSMEGRGLPDARVIDALGRACALEELMSLAAGKCCGAAPPPTEPGPDPVWRAKDPECAKGGGQGVCMAQV